MEFVYFQVFAVGRDRDIPFAGCKIWLGHTSTTHGQALRNDRMQIHTARPGSHDARTQIHSLGESIYDAPGHALVRHKAQQERVPDAGS